MAILSVRDPEMSWTSVSLQLEHISDAHTGAPRHNTVAHWGTEDLLGGLPPHDCCKQLDVVSPMPDAHDALLATEDGEAVDGED